MKRRRSKLDDPVEPEPNPDTALEAGQDAANEPSPPGDSPTEVSTPETPLEHPAGPEREVTSLPEEVSSNVSATEASPLPEQEPPPPEPDLAEPQPAQQPEPAPMTVASAAITSAPPTMPRGGNLRSPADLEQRVRRLEEALSSLQQGRPFVIPTPLPTPVPQGLPLSAAPAQPVPTARVVADPPVAVPLPPAGPSPSRSVPNLGNRGPSWLFWEMWIELRVYWRMYTDPRYQLTWFGRLVPLALFVIFVFSSYFLPLASVPVLGGWFEKLGQLVIAYLLVKCLGYEARRYRQTAPDLPASLRL